MRDLINFPEEHETYKEKNGKGTSVFFVVQPILRKTLQRQPKSKEDVRWAAIKWPLMRRSIVAPPGYIYPQTKYQKRYRNGVPVDALILAGASSTAFFSEASKTYWFARESDLNPYGRQVFSLLTNIYGVKPEIVTLVTD